MNKKPSKQTLISFLYDELGQDERNEVELYLSQNPSEKKKLEDLNFVRTTLRHLADKEVIATPFFDSNKRSKTQLRDNKTLKWAIGIAATLICGMVLARVLGLSFVFHPGELIISFQTNDKTHFNSSYINRQETVSLIQASIVDNNQKLQQSLMQDMQSYLAKDNNLRKAEVEKLLYSAYSNKNRQSVELEKRLQEKYQAFLNQYFQNTVVDQKEYTEELFIKFAQYLREQRNQDLKFIESRLNAFEQNTDQFKEETDLLLSSLISNFEILPNENTQ